MSNLVFVLGTNRKPLTPCKPGVARSLLKARKAAVFRHYPFTIILKKEVDATPEPLELKLDPGSKVTGIAIKQGGKIIFGAELQHRGQQIKGALLSRRQLRRGRRNRKTRYRQPRFLNRTRPDGWLAPSLQHRVDTALTWVNRFRRLAPIGSIAQELVRFDLQLMQNPEISGVQYQQGKLQGYEVREYLLEKWGPKCAYCGAENIALEVEHIQPRSKGGSDRVSNLALACNPCNQRKGNQDIRDFLSGKSDLLNRILKQAKAPLRDAAAVNSTRWALFNALKQTGLPVATGTGIDMGFPLVIAHGYRFIRAFRLAILLLPPSPQVRKSAPMWDGFSVAPLAVSILPQPPEEWQASATNTANQFTERMAIAMGFDSGDSSRQSRSSPCPKPGASRSFFGEKLEEEGKKLCL